MEADLPATCPDCHQGIAHELPEGWQTRYEQMTQKLAAEGGMSLPDGRIVADAKMQLQEYLQQ